MTDREKERRLWESWKELVALQAQANAKMIQLIEHPDATDEQILAAAKGRREAMRLMREMKPRTIAGLNKLGASMLARMVEGIR